MPLMGLLGQGQLASLLIADTRSYARLCNLSRILADRSEVSLSVNDTSMA